MSDVSDWKEPAWEPLRPDRKSLTLARAVAEHVRVRPDECFATARRNITKMREHATNDGARRWLAEWEYLIGAGPDAVVAMLTERSVHGADMRQMNPFAGVLSEEERQALLDEFARADRRDVR